MGKREREEVREGGRNTEGKKKKEREGVRKREGERGGE